MPSKWTWAGIAAALVLVGGGAAAYAFSKKIGLSVSVFPKAVTRGDLLTFSGSGFTPNGAVTVEVHTQVPGAGTLRFEPGRAGPYQIPAGADSDGKVAGSFQVGDNIGAGPQLLKVTDLTTGSVATASWTLS